MEPLEVGTRLQTSILRFRETGSQWFASLPDRINELEAAWDLRVTEVLEASLAFVAIASLASGGEAILKMPIPHRESANEPDALDLWKGEVSVRLIERGPFGAMLLESCEPGSALGDLGESEDVPRIGASVLGRLHVPPPAGHSFEHLDDVMGGWARLSRSRFESFGRPFETSIAEEGFELLESLPKSERARVVLHGDFHEWNILRARREPWLVIDPKPMVGDPTFDSAQYMRNRFAAVRGDLASFRRQAEVFAHATGFSPGRVWQWSLARGVESALWSLSVGDQAEFQLDLALIRAVSRLIRL